MNFMHPKFQFGFVWKQMYPALEPSGMHIENQKSITEYVESASFVYAFWALWDTKSFILLKIFMRFLRSCRFLLIPVCAALQVIPQLMGLLRSPHSICWFGALCLDMSLPQLLQKIHFVAYIDIMGARRNVGLSVCLVRKMMCGVTAWGFRDLLNFDLAQWRRIPDARNVEWNLKRQEWFCS